MNKEHFEEEYKKAVENNDLLKIYHSKRRYLDCEHILLDNISGYYRTYIGQSQIIQEKLEKALADCCIFCSKKPKDDYYLFMTAEEIEKIYGKIFPAKEEKYIIYKNFKAKGLKKMKTFKMVRTKQAEEFICHRCDKKKKAKNIAYNIIDNNIQLCNGCFGLLLSKKEIIKE